MLILLTSGLFETPIGSPWLVVILMGIAAMLAALTPVGRRLAPLAKLIGLKTLPHNWERAALPVQELTSNECAQRLLQRRAYECGITTSKQGAPPGHKSGYVALCRADIGLIFGADVAKLVEARHPGLFSSSAVPTDDQMENLASDLWTLGSAAAAQSKSFPPEIHAEVRRRLQPSTPHVADETVFRAAEQESLVREDQPSPGA